MSEPVKYLRRGVTATTFLLIALLILQALGYGLGFFIDPASGLVEFASPPPPGHNELTEALVGLVGVGMIGAAALLVLSAVLVARRNLVGSYVTMLVGGVYVLAGVAAFRTGWAWDASFYAGSGVLLIVLSAGLVRLDRVDARLGE